MLSRLSFPSSPMSAPVMGDNHSLLEIIVSFTNDITDTCMGRNCVLHHLNGVFPTEIAATVIIIHRSSFRSVAI